MRNKYPGNCCICNKRVAAGEGYAECSPAKKWFVRCKKCVGKGAPWKQKCNICGKTVLPGKGHRKKTKEDEGGGWYSIRWTVYCDKCQNEEVKGE